MRLVLKILAFLVGGLVLLVGGGLVFLALASPKSRPPDERKAEQTPEQLARGKHLVDNVLGCWDCHAARDWNSYAGPVVAGTEGEGGRCDEDVGTVCPPNISSDPTHGIGAWSDGELRRALREGIGRDGHAIFGMMPWESYSALSERDIDAVVAHLRTLPPRSKPNGGVNLMFPVNLMTKMGPVPLEGPVADPPAGDTVALGRYLAQVATCRECHTDDPEKPFSGGAEFGGPWGTVYSANLTPAPGTWMSQATREAFIARFKTFENAPPIPATPGTNTLMPWMRLAKLTEAEFGAIYDYLKTLPPTPNEIPARPSVAAGSAP